VAAHQSEDGSPPANIAGAIGKRLRMLESTLGRLLASKIIRFDDTCRGSLPEQHGAYRIFDLGSFDETIRAGRTKKAAAGLRQRVYQNHLMGDQAGNLRSQMVVVGIRVDMEAAKQLMRETYAAQVLVVTEAAERTSLEHFMIAVLRPRYSD
jgi:hypothetical protein